MLHMARCSACVEAELPCANCKRKARKHPRCSNCVRSQIACNECKRKRYQQMVLDRDAARNNVVKKRKIATSPRSKVVVVYNPDRKKNRELIEAAKSQPCTDCGRCFPSCAMQFDHHLGKKNFNIGVLWYQVDTSLLIKELALCEIVCANCHAVRTMLRAFLRRGGKPHYMRK